MSTNIEEHIDAILRREGGYVDHPADRGGATNHGVTIHTYSEYLGRPATKQEVRDMPQDVARDIFLSKYYRRPRIDKLVEPIRAQLLDMSVNHGARNAVRMLQRVIVQAEIAPLVTDGLIGYKTIMASEKAQDDMGNYFTNAIVDERVKFYNAIVARRPNQGVFLRGWLKRAEEFRVAV